MLRPPDLSRRPFSLSIERVIALPRETLYRAWTEQIDHWFAAPGSVLMRAEVDAPFFFETVHRLETQAAAERHPHYGRFLRLEPARLVELTWVTGAGGTKGAETVVTVEPEPPGTGTPLRPPHPGVPGGESRRRPVRAGPPV